MAYRYRFDDVEVDLQSFRLLKSGKVVSVEPKVLNLLIFLVENRGRLVERKELIDAVWGDAFVTDHVLNYSIGQLRKGLADDAKRPRIIETVPTLGYRFIAQVEAEGPEGAEAPATPFGVERILRKLPAKLQEPAQSTDAVAQQVVSDETSRRSRQRTAIVAIGAVLLVAAGAMTYWIDGRRAHVSGGEPVRSLVVLPLANLSGDPSQDYLADGMTDELITGLGQIGALRVISPTTAMQYKNAHKPLPEIARELNVEDVVEGSVAREGDKVRIAAQLIDARDDKQLWARNFDGDLGDILGLQNQVTSAVADQIRIKLTSKEQTQLADTRPVNPRAYEALLKGYFFESNLSDVKSLQYFKQAAELDPKFARAYVGIARAYNFLADSFYNPNIPRIDGLVPVGEATAASDAAIAKALELDPELAEAYAQRAWTLLIFHWDYPGAARDFRHALDLDPNASSAHQGFANYYVAMEKFDEGLQEMRKARDLDPLSPLVLTDYCNDLRYARRYDDALAQCMAALELDPDYEWGFEIMADVYDAKGDYSDVHKIFATRGGCDAACLAMIDEIHGAPGEAGAYDAWLKAQKTQPGAFFIATANARLGRKDEAFAWLEKAYEQRADVAQMLFLGVDPQFDQLRSDPRFDAFLRHAGLPSQPPISGPQSKRPSTN